MTARYVRALLQHQEREVALSGLFATTGFDFGAPTEADSDNQAKQRQD